MMRKLLADRPEEVPRIQRLIGFVADGAPGHVQVTCCHRVLLDWVNEGSWDGLSLLAGLVQHYRTAVFEGWRNCVSAE